MKWLRRIIIPVTVVALIGTGGFLLYNVVGAKAEVSGYRDGYLVGHSAGYNLGKQEGYNSGKKDGYGEGYDSGKMTGYDQGKEDGYKAGYDDGVQAEAGHGFVPGDPTYQQAVAFLRQDRTSENVYVDPSYVCSHFARDVNSNAEKSGLRCAFVEIRYQDKGHTIVAFNTIDKGLVYFEPQSDETVNPVVGKRFFQCIEPRPGYYYPPPAYDDTILDVVVVW